MRLKLLTSIVLMGLAGAAAAQEAKPAFEFAMHGFASASLYVQDAPTYASPGQQVLSASGEYQTDKLFLGGDVRQSRFNFSVKGPQVLGDATPKAILEIDFFGMNQLGNAGGTPGAFGEQSVIPRIRMAYVELAFPNTTIWVGQQNDLTFAAAPMSLTHMAFPLGYETGNIGWRTPSIFGFHRMALGDFKTEFAWQLGAAGWNFTPAAATYVTAGSASSLPKVELRYTLSSGGAFNAWVAGHWNRIDTNGPNAVKTACDTGTPCSTRDVVAGAAGAKVSMMGFTLQGAGWYGKNTGNLLGNLVQFTPDTYVGDLFGWGVWGQVGFNFTPQLSAWYMIGTSQLVDWAYAEDQNLARLRNVDNVLLLQYREGGFAMGLEWANFFTTTRASATTDQAFHANQWALTTNYYF